jgi:hypothetical protein
MNGKPGTRRGVITIVPNFSLILHDLAEAHAYGNSEQVNWMGMQKTKGADAWRPKM